MLIAAVNMDISKPETGSKHFSFTANTMDYRFYFTRLF